jgi:hypothetical protein
MSDCFNYQTIRKRVYDILINNDAAKDDDKLLLKEFWTTQTEAKTKDEVFEDLVKGRLSVAETITRARRDLQLQSDKLRGKKWYDRHKVQPLFCSQLTLFSIY